MSRPKYLPRHTRVARRAQWRPLFEPGVKDSAGTYNRPLRCRICQRRFRRWNGTTNHGFMHLEQQPLIVRAHAQSDRWEFEVLQ